MIVLLLSMLIIKLEAITVNQKDQHEKQRIYINKSFNNWTTCEEFLKGTTFDEKRLLNKDWKVFYSWAREYEDPYTVRFRMPSQMEIDRFKESIDKKVSKSDRPSNVSWNEPAFFMESTIDLTALYFRTENPGKYQVVSSLVFEYSIKPKVLFGLKIVEPGYFAFLNCEFKVGSAFAPTDMMPKDEEIHLKAAARLFNVSNPLGYPHKLPTYMPNATNFVDVETGDDADDEEETEIQRHGEILQDATNRPFYDY